MKIDIAEAEKIEELLRQLRRNQNMLEHISSNPESQHSLWHTTLIGDVTITHEELTAIVRARIDASVKHLAQRYQMDFAKANINSLAPAAPAASAAEANAQ